MIDGTGAVVYPFHQQGVGPYTNQSLTQGTVIGMAPTSDGEHFIIWGVYNGYDDGVTNDTLQRFVTRLHAGELTVAVGTKPTTSTNHLRLYPNPTDGLVMIDHDLQSMAVRPFIRIKDALGRDLESHQLTYEKGQLVIDTRRFEAGMYTVELINGDRMVHLERLIVQ